MKAKKALTFGVLVLCSLLFLGSLGCKSPFERRVEEFGKRMEEDAKTAEKATKEYIEILDKLSKGEISQEEADKKMEELAEETKEKLHIEIEED
jgi:hypothetical protein